MNNKQWRTIEREICALLKRLKGDIGDEYRCDDCEDGRPGMLVTVSTRDGSSWSYQTGDNSYSGACYGDPHWALVYLYRRSNCAELAAEAVQELADAVREAQENEKFSPARP